MNLKRGKIFGAMVCLAFVAAAILETRASPWNSANDPAQFQQSYNYALSKLPTKARLKTPPWSDTYWPSKLSGIAHRWYAKDPNDFEYTVNSKEDIMKMTTDQLSQLSPAEKYDVYMGRYDFPTVKSEWMRTSPQDAGWEGLCHGWAPAAIVYQQPNPTKMTNKDGITIPFGSSDVKALLTYYLAEYDPSTSTVFCGERCNFDIEAHPENENVSECADINAGSFHVVALNELQANRGFIIDRDRSYQVWNQPVYSILVIPASRRRINGANGAVAQQTFYVNITYIVEVVPQWQSYEPYTNTANYDYTLELDSQGNIVGGSYLSWQRSDFLWMSHTTSNNFNGYLSGLADIYAASTGDHSRGSSVIHTSLLLRSSTHEVLTKNGGSFGIKNYRNNMRKSWSIHPKAGGKQCIELTFSEFSTERFRDKVRIYESAGAEGALLAVLHGSKDMNPSSLIVHADGVFVLFVSDQQHTDYGFTVHYRLC